MNREKLDEFLSNKIYALGLKEGIECLVTTKDENCLKRYIKDFEKKIIKKYPFTNTFSAKLSKCEISMLSESDSVVYISSNSSVFALMHVSKKILHTDGVYKGKGQTICFIDTGINCHCDFMLCENRIVDFVDFIDGKKEIYDDNGHGTFVAGVCSGSGIMSGQKYSGIAPRSRIISLKALDKNGEANSSKILEAMQYVYDNRNRIDVVCMSFGSEPIGINDPIMIGAEKLWNSGIVVVAAAGNSGPEYQTIKSPGSSRKIITVGGFDDNRFEDGKFNPNFFEMAYFSSRGPCYRYSKPDVIAPAVDIVSCAKSYGYTKLSGTSVATPMIAGICAIIKESEKNISPNQVKNKLLLSCKPAFFNRNFEGYGIPDLSKILR